MKNLESHILTILLGLSIGVFYPSVKLLVSCLIVTAVIALWKFQARPYVRKQTTFKAPHTRHIPVTFKS